MKFLLLTSMLLVAAFVLPAQITMTPAKNPAIVIKEEPRLFVNIHTGYSVGLGSTFKFYPDDISSIKMQKVGFGEPSKTVAYSNPTKGLGDGFKFGLGASYVLNDFISVGLDFDYFSSTIKKYRDSTFDHTNIPGGGTIADEYHYAERNTTSYQATLLSFTPNITFKAISRPKWFLYNKLGAVITVRPNSLQEDRTDYSTRMGWQGFYKDSSYSMVKKYEWGIRNPAFGFMGAFGGQIKIAEKMRAFAELQFTHIVFVIKKRTLTEFSLNEQRLENGLPTSQRELEFVKSYSTTVTNPDPNKPSQTIIQRIPITYVGLQAGITYYIK